MSPEEHIDDPLGGAFREEEGKEVTLLREVDRRLLVYGSSDHHNKGNLLEELAFIILSAQTEYYLYEETFGELRSQFPRWEDLLEASEDEIASAIRRGGLAHKKAAQLKGALQKIKADRGTLSLEFLRELDDEEARRYLVSLPGIGHKSASCILMYVLDRHVFPVDTHVWRVCRRLALTPQVPKPTLKQELELESKVPADIRYSLHVNLLSHGQQTCTTYWPKCESCILSDICPSCGQPDQVWGQWRRPGGVWSKAVDGNRD